MLAIFMYQFNINALTCSVPNIYIRL